MLDKQSRNLGTDGTITITMVVNIKSMAHVYSNTLLSIFLRRDTIVFWKMSLLYWLTKLTHQTLYREKTIGEVPRRTGAMGTERWRLCLTTGSKRIIIRTWFTETILVPMIFVSTFISITAVAVFIFFFIFIVAISEIVLVLFLPLLVLVWLLPLLL